MIEVQRRLRKGTEGESRSQDRKVTLRTDWGRALQKTNMKKSGSGAHGSKDENQETMTIIGNTWLIN